MFIATCRRAYAPSTLKKVRFLSSTRTRSDDGPPTGAPLRSPPPKRPQAHLNKSKGVLDALNKDIAREGASSTDKNPASDFFDDLSPNSTSQTAAAEASPISGYDRSKWPHYRIYCKSSNNNTIITFTDDNGNPLSWSSAGLCGFRGTRGSSPEAAYTATVQIIRSIQRVREHGRAAASEKSPIALALQAEEANKQNYKQKKAINRGEGVDFLLDIYLNGFGAGRSVIVQTLAAPEGEDVRELLSVVRDNTPIKVGGVRAKKARRV